MLCPHSSSRLRLDSGLGTKDNPWAFLWRGKPCYEPKQEGSTDGTLAPSDYPDSALSWKTRWTSVYTIYGHLGGYANPRWGHSVVRKTVHVGPRGVQT